MCQVRVDNDTWKESLNVYIVAFIQIVTPNILSIDSVNQILKFSN